MVRLRFRIHFRTTKTPGWKAVVLKPINTDASIFVEDYEEEKPPSKEFSVFYVRDYKCKVLVYFTCL